MLRISCLFFSAFCFCCCNPAAREEPAGGACTYNYDTTGARIISIDSISANQYNLFVTLDSGGRYNNDTINYFTANQHYLTQAELNRDTITVNDTICFITGRIVNGSCNPVISRLELKHFLR